MKNPVHVLDSSMWIGLANEHPTLLYWLCHQAMQHRIHVGLPAHVEIEVVGAKARDHFQRQRKNWRSRIGELEVFLKLISSAETTPAVNECQRAMQELRRLVESCKSDPQADAIERLFASECVVRIECPSSLHKAVIAMGLERRRPFGKKNSVADTMILLSVVRWARRKRSRPIVFHTLNRSDFSDENSPDRPHSDVSEFFAPHTNVVYSHGYASLQKLLNDLSDLDMGGPPEWGNCLLCGETVLIESISCVGCGAWPTYVPDDENYRLTRRGDGYLVDVPRDDGEIERLVCRLCGRRTFSVELPSLCSYHQHMADSD